tara:strand:+ start:769 stop:1704 length:936 start_codon:yes stop_codon:yes gene_type:complete
MSSTKRYPPVLFLMGATNTGKSEFAMKLCDYLPIELISVDSALIYRGMNIGTAKPTRDQLKKYPHRLIDICDPADSYSVKYFLEDALSAMDEISRAGKIPLLVGGTMLYFRALEKGLSKLPQINSKIRDMIKKDLFEKGIEFLYSQLKMVDPNISKRIHKNDTQRITRALEVFQQTGQPLSEFQKKSLKQKMPYRAIKFARMPENRESLYKSIDSRFEKMLSIGFEDEVKRLIDRGDLNAEMPSMRAVGYRQMWDYLHGDCSYGEMVKKGQAASRQLAKRQMTWLRSELNTNWLDNFNKNSISKVEKKLKI